MYPNKTPTPSRQQSQFRYLGALKIAGITILIGVVITFFATRPEQIPAPETRTGYIETLAAKSGARIKLDDVGKFQLLQNNHILINDGENQQILKVNLSTGESTKLFDTKQFGTHPFRGNGKVTAAESFLVETENKLYVRLRGRETEPLLRVDITDGTFEVLVTPPPENSFTHGPIIIDDKIVVTFRQSDGLVFLSLDGTEDHRILASKRFKNFTLGFDPSTILATDGRNLLYRIDVVSGKETVLTSGTTLEFREFDNDEITYTYDVYPTGVPTEVPNGEVFVALNSKHGGCAFIGKVVSTTEIEHIAGSAPSCHGTDPAPALEGAIQGSFLALTEAGDLLIAGHHQIQRIVGVTPPFQSATNSR